MVGGYAALVARALAAEDFFAIIGRMDKKAAVAVVLLCVGCAGAGPTGATNGRRGVVPVTTWRAHDAKAIDHDGVGVVAGIITWDSARRYHDAMVVVHWLEGNDKMPTSRTGNVGVIGPKAERWGEVPILPMPTFMLGIANRSDHPVRVDPAQLELVDGAGGHYRPLSDLGSITGRVEEQMFATYRGLINAPAIRDGVREKIATLKLLTKPVVVAPGSDWVGYVAFALPATGPAELGEYAERVGTVELRFSDEKGTVPIAFDKVVGSLMVMCPDDEKPALDRCLPGGAMPTPSAHGP
jgi:hypothetical protein